MSELVTVIARLRAKTGQETRLREELQRLVAPTRAEEGCVSYELHESSEHAGHFMFFEIWRSHTDLEAHFQTPHMLALSLFLPALLEEPLDLTTWRKL